MSPSQRPRPVGPGAQPLGEIIEELAHPGPHDVIDGHTIDAGRPAVSTDLAPSLPEHVAAGDLVIEGVEPTIRILLSTAVEHALESTNTVHARGAADGSSRFGTHQSPSHPSRASMKRGPFPMWPAFPTSEYYDPLRLPLDRPHHFPGSPVIGGHRFPPPAAAGPRRLSRVPRTTIRTFNAQYAGGFLSARFWIPGAFRGLRRHLTGSAPSLPAHRRSLDDAYSGFTHVADRTVAHAPLRTRPLDHARGHHYRGPRRLPGPDSHRQATLNLSLFTSCGSPFPHGAGAVSAHQAKARAAPNPEVSWPLLDVWTGPDRPTPVPRTPLAASTRGGGGC